MLSQVTMAPVPEENQDKPSNANNEDSEINNFSNPNVMYAGTAGSSDDEDNFESNAFGGYTLLPQEPEDDDEDEEGSDLCHSASTRNDTLHSEKEAETLTCTNLVCGSQPEALIESEMTASAPSVTLTNDSCHQAFLAKFPDRKVPSYLQVLSMPRDKDQQLWNQKRQDTDKFSLDSAQESKIIGAMSGFSLPVESIPDWAKNLPDDQWPLQILERIGRKSDSKKSIDEHKKQHLEESFSGTSWTAEFSETGKTNNLAQE
ncbi:hypothetical protein Btru_008945 [Bulinus truncatus]|nr:hypothetical protein Btru_008945 [Bulinus truncatus]